MFSHIIIFLSLLIAFAKAQLFNPCEGRHLEFVNDYSSCSRYFSCVNSFPHPVECNDGRWFNLNPLGCFLPETVPCERCPATGSQIVADPTSCRHYLVCVNGEEIARRECADNLLFDPVLGSCAREENVFCPLRVKTFAGIPTVPNVVPTVPTAVPIPR